VKDAYISGTVYNDVDNSCSGAGFVGQTVTLSDGGGGISITTDGAGKFNFTKLSSGTRTLAVSLPTGYICSPACNGGSCSTVLSVPPDVPNKVFYLTQAREAWWQVLYAGAYAGGASGTVVQSELPLATTKLITRSMENYEGALLRSGGNIDLGAGSVSTPGWSAKSTYMGTKMDYAFFAKKLGVIAGQSPSWTTTLGQGDCTPGEDFCYGPGATIANNWNVTSGQKYVVFVDGDLQIKANVIVAPGGFLAVIVKGKVTVDPSVTSVQGLYVMDNDFVTSGATQLDVQGSIVAWGNISLGRDLGADNITNPAEKFTHRMDLLLNMPESMKTFQMEWNEVVPGTYGE